MTPDQHAAVTALNPASPDLPNALLLALRAAEAFIAVFEDDEDHAAAPLAMIRAAIRAEEGLTGTPSRDLICVRRFLDFSTGHLTPATRVLLEGAYERPPLPVASTAYGWFIWVPPDAADRPADPDEGVPPDLWAVLACARMLGCDWVQFDRDAEPVEWLPWHEPGEEPRVDG